MAKQTFEEVSETIMKYLGERGLDKTNTDRGIAISISLEANELLEYFQWSEETFGTKQDIASELADILIYSIHLARRNDIDLMNAVAKKVEEQAKKYPVEIFKIKDKDERDRAFLEAKKSYKKNTTL